MYSLVMKRLCKKRMYNYMHDLWKKLLLGLAVCSCISLPAKIYAFCDLFCLIWIKKKRKRKTKIAVSVEIVERKQLCFPVLNTSHPSICSSRYSLRHCISFSLPIRDTCPLFCFQHSVVQSLLWTEHLLPTSSFLSGTFYTIGNLGAVFVHINTTVTPCTDQSLLAWWLCEYWSLL